MADQPPPRTNFLALPPEHGGTRPATVIVATVLVCLPLLALAQTIAHIRLDEFDAWLFAYYGKQMTNGYVLYEQLWDNKPPGIFWLNAAAMWLSGGSPTGIIVLCALAAAGTCTVFFLLTRRLYGIWVAAIATAVAVPHLYQHFFHVGCNRPSTFFSLTELAAVLLYVRAVTSADTKWRSLALAGFVAGLGVWLKQSALAAAAAMGAHQVLLIAAGFQPVGPGLRRIGLLAGGWLGAVVLAAIVVLFTSDIGSAWQAIVTFNRAYFLPEAGSQWLPEWFGLREQMGVLALPLILALATLAHAVAVRVTRPKTGDHAVTPRVTIPPMWLALLWVWMAAGTYLALVGPHKRLHYLGIALPPLCMLAAHGIHLFLSSGRRIDRSYPPYYLFVGVLWCGYMLITPVGDQLHALNRHYFLRYEVPEPDSRVVTAELIRRNTAPTDTLFVWPYDPEIYFRADRPPAIRYIATEKAYQLGRAGQPVMDETIALLRDARPKILVIPPDQVTRFTEPHRKDQLKYGDMGAWVRENYRLHEEATREDVWVRKAP